MEPNTVRSKYLKRFIELRTGKDELTEAIAVSKLEDNIVLGTMMLEGGDVDGLVSGSTHTTADTIRPALQLIKDKKEKTFVSSIFFMLCPEKVVIYGDCAVNPDPTPEQLARIAIQSAISATSFFIDEPRIAMISYSTGSSGTGISVDKVREATRIAKKIRPDLVIDGPIQYDAATIEEVARRKAPHSPIIGDANVLIFPNLDAGNATYKAVQRISNVPAIGPVLQGISKPVNDLSRGASVEDIIYTIAATSIQSSRS